MKALHPWEESQILLSVLEIRGFFCLFVSWGGYHMHCRA